MERDRSEREPKETGVGPLELRVRFKALFFAQLELYPRQTKVRPSPQGFPLCRIQVHRQSERTGRPTQRSGSLLQVQFQTSGSGQGMTAHRLGYVRLRPKAGPTRGFS